MYIKYCYVSLCTIGNFTSTIKELSLLSDVLEAIAVTDTEGSGRKAVQKTCVAVQ